MNESQTNQARTSGTSTSCTAPPLAPPLPPTIAAPPDSASTGRHARRAQRGYARKAILLFAVVFVVGLLVACAPRAASEETQSGAAEERPVLTIEWSPASDCAVCHVEEGASEAAILCTAAGTGAAGTGSGEGTTTTADASAGASASADASTSASADEGASDCFVCHTDESALQTVHAEITTADPLPRRLTETDISDETCLACHYGTKEALVAATTGLAPVTDLNGLAINPHNPGLDGHDSIACGSCHNQHTSSDLAANAKDTCMSCHHQNVFECYTCHP